MLLLLPWSPLINHTLLKAYKSINLQAFVLYNYEANSTRYNLKLKPIDPPNPVKPVSLEYLENLSDRLLSKLAIANPLNSD